MPIPWDKTVEFFHSGPSYSVARAHMTLRDAVAHFLALPPGEQNLCGIGVHEAILKEIDGRPAVLGFLRPQAIRTLASDPGFGGAR